MMYSKRHLPDIEQWNQSSGSNVIPRRARPGLAGLRPHTRPPEGEARGEPPTLEPVEPALEPLTLEPAFEPLTSALEPLAPGASRLEK